jgi:hypothetical protein
MKGKTSLSTDYDEEDYPTGFGRQKSGNRSDKNNKDPDLAVFLTSSLWLHLSEAIF